MASLINNPYSDTMRSLIGQYRSLIRQAKEYRSRNGAASVDEARCYQEAANICKQIIDFNSDEPIRVTWLETQKLCEEQMIANVNELKSGAAAPAPAPAASVPAAAPVPPADPVPEAPPECAAETQSNSAKQQNASYPDKTTTVPSTDPDDPRPITTTPTGFVTRNATAHIKAETIEGWYVRTRPSHDFKDICGMEKLKSSLLKTLELIKMQLTCKKLELSPFTCMLLYGPQGTGKTYIIEAFAAELMDRGFKFMKLESGDIHQSLVGESEKVIGAAFQEAIDNAPCAIYIDEFEGVSVPRDKNAQGYEKRLTIALIEEYVKLKNSDKPIILLGASNRPNMIDPAWIDRMESCELLPLPSEHDRQAYFDAKLSKFGLTDDLDFDYIVDKTDNYNYRDMDTVVRAMKKELAVQLLDSHAVLDDENNIDYELTDQLASEYIQNGEPLISRELFDNVCSTHLPSPKETFMADLEEFEKMRLNAKS